MITLNFILANQFLATYRVFIETHELLKIFLKSD